MKYYGKLFKETMKDYDKKTRQLVDEISDDVIKDLNEEEIKQLKTNPPYSHFGFGLYIRNNYIYNNPKIDFLVEPDSLSGMIYAKIIEKILKKELIEKLREHGFEGNDYVAITCLIKKNKKEIYKQLIDYMNNNKEVNTSDILDYTFDITNTEFDEFEIED